MDPILDPILLVDDEKDNLQAIQRLLRGEYQVTVTTSPIEALKLVKSQLFHIIISDQRMPGMSGVELLEKVKKLSPGSTRILLTGYTDIESVIESINRGHIYRYIAKPWDPEDLKLTLRQANEAFKLRKEVEEKNAELEKTNRELEETLTELTLLDKAKARFLSLVSHELNTPLTVLNSFMGLLSQSQSELSGDLQKSVKALSGAVHRFSEIVGEVLTYTKLESVRKLRLTRVSLGAELQKMVVGLSSQSKTKQISFTLEQTEVLEESFDWEKMDLALTRIFSAVIERAKGESQIRLRCAEEQGKLTLTIVWEGDSLPSQAFQPFETGSSELHHHQNLGLSLAIAKLIIETHGGKIITQDTASETNQLKLILK
jgi:signal transduction histidine kinase